VRGTPPRPATRFRLSVPPSPCKEPTFSPPSSRPASRRPAPPSPAAKLDLLVAAGHQLQYLTGYNPGRSERLIALFLPLKGDPIIVCPAFEVERLKLHSVPAALRPWEEEENPYNVVHDIARELKPLHRRGQVGLEPTTAYQTLLRLDDKMDNWEFHPTDALFASCASSRRPRRS